MEEELSGGGMWAPAPAPAATFLLFLERTRRVTHLRTFVLAGPAAQNALSPHICMSHSLSSFRPFFLCCLLVEDFLATLPTVSFPPLVPPPPALSVPFPCSVFLLSLIITQHTMHFAFLLRCFCPLRRHGFSMRAGIFVCVFTAVSPVPLEQCLAHRLSQKRVC